MLILDSEQVKYCQVIAHIEGQKRIESGLIYQDDVFLKVKSYAREDLEKAIRECRENYLDNDDIEVPILVIKSVKEVTLWLEDNRFKPEQSSHQEITQNNTSNNFDLDNLVAKMRGKDGLAIKTRRYQLKLYQRCFVGTEAVDWLTKNLQISRPEAVAIGQQLIDKKVIHHVSNEHSFKDEPLFYRFYEDEGKSIWTDKVL